MRVKCPSVRTIVSQRHRNANPIVGHANLKNWGSLAREE
jgi:hypothetical protein